MTAAIDVVAIEPSLWTVLGHELPEEHVECNAEGCAVARPWQIFCPEHEHLLILGSDRPTDPARWKPRWLLAHASRFAVVAVFPLAARWGWPVPLFLLALGVNGYLIWVLTRNYTLTGGPLRRGAIFAAAGWIVLRIAADQRVHHESVGQVLRWVPFLLVFAAGASLWHPVIQFLRDRLHLDKPTTTLACGWLCAGLLLTMAITASNSVLAEGALPPFVSRWLVIIGAGALAVSFVVGFVQAWWVGRTLVPRDVEPYVRRSRRVATGQSLVLEPESTPVQIPRPVRRTFTQGVRDELLKMSRRLAALQRATLRTLLRAAATVRTQLIVTTRTFRCTTGLFFAAMGRAIKSAAHCVGWLGYRLAVPGLACMVTAAAAWGFATKLTNHFYRSGIFASIGHALIAAGYADLAIGSTFIAWTLVCGCPRDDVLNAAWGAIRVVAPRLLLVFTVGAVVVELLSVVFDLSPIHPGPLTILALLLVALSFATEERRHESEPASTQIVQ